MALHGGEWSASHPDYFTAGKRTLSTHASRTLGLTPEPVWTFYITAISLAPGRTWTLDCPAPSSYYAILTPP